MSTRTPARTLTREQQRETEIRLNRGAHVASTQVELASQTTSLVSVQQMARKRIIPMPLQPPSVIAQLVRRLDMARKVHKKDNATHAYILAVIPAYETEDQIDQTVRSLLTQSRPIDKIAVVINGPGISTAARDCLQWLVEAEPGRLSIHEPPQLNGTHPSGKSKGSKVGALNFAYEHYIQRRDSIYDFVLGVDADIEADREMVHHLEVDLIKRVKAAGTMARYSFKIPDDTKGKSLALIHGQRHEFAVTGIKQQLRGYTSDILGGQATLFRVEALNEAAAVTDGGRPWSARSQVEDAELTRTFQKLGYACATSARARAWTGLMHTPNAWQKQRRKWQDGHLTDMIRDFRPFMDARRWRDQFALGWNLLLRILFFVTVTISIALHQFKFHPLWLVPVGLAILQSVLVAHKIPDRTLREIVRSFLFVPGELYYVRTLSVWLDSVALAIVNVRRDGWRNQARAEGSSSKKYAASGWLIILVAIAVPLAGLLLCSNAVSVETMSIIVTCLWYATAILTIGSTLGMLWLIIRMIRNCRRLAP